MGPGNHGPYAKSNSLAGQTTPPNWGNLKREESQIKIIWKEPIRNWSGNLTRSGERQADSWPNSPRDTKIYHPYKKLHFRKKTNFSDPWKRKQERNKPHRSSPNKTEEKTSWRRSKWSRPIIQPWKAGGGKNWQKGKDERTFPVTKTTGKRGKKLWSKAKKKL